MTPIIFLYSRPIDYVNTLDSIQKPIVITFRGHEVGTFYADFVVDNKVIVEIKAVSTLLPEPDAQVINYRKASGIEIGLLVNFGRPKLEFKRFYKSPKLKLSPTI